MMTLSIRAKNAVLGALVADAATLGAHWIYDQQRIHEIAPANPEFLSPSPTYIEGSVGYFAHEGKQVGDLSQYGHQMLVLLKSLASTKGTFCQSDYLEKFSHCFGYGGSYVGYIDRSTRDTLNNVARHQEALEARMMNVPGELGDAVKRSLVNKVLSAAKQAKGEALKRKVAEAVKIANDDESHIAHAMSLIDIWEAGTHTKGSSDIQLPAIAKLPPLVGCYTKHSGLQSVLEKAIRVTNDNDVSVEFGLAVASMLEAVIDGGNITDALRAAQSIDTPRFKPLVKQALSMSGVSSNEVAQHFGLACNLEYGVPVIIHNLETSTTYVDAVRRNLAAGGDNCGRSIMLGAIMGAAHGVGGTHGIPHEWMSQVRLLDEAQEYVSLLSA